MSEPTVETTTREVSPGVVEITTITKYPDGRMSKSVQTKTTTKVTKTNVVRQKRLSSRKLNTVQFMSSEQVEGVEADWILLQRKTFVRWCNTFLAQRNIAIVDLNADLQDGLVLIRLMELLSGRTIRGYSAKPKMKIQKCVNIQCALDFITKTERLKLVGIGPQDIYEGNPRLILGLIWTLILHYQLASGKWGGGNVKQALLDWCNRALATQGLKVNDFKASWTDGRAFIGLVNYLCTVYKIDTIKYDAELTETQLIDLAFVNATKLFQIPQLLDAEDMATPDENSIVAYLSYFRQKDSPESIESFTRDSASADFTMNTIGGDGAGAIGKAEGGADDDNTGAGAGGVVSGGAVGGGAGISGPKKSSQKPKTVELTVVPNNTTAEGEGLRQALCGKRAKFIVTTRDRVNQILYIASSKITVTIEFEGRKLAQKVHITDLEDGNYEAEYMVNKAGTYYIMIFCNGQAIRKEKWWVKVRPGELSGAFCEAKGSGLQAAIAGITAQFVVITKDGFGNACDIGGAELVGTFAAVKGNSDNLPTVKFNDKNDGTYDASYVIKIVGEYVLTILAAGEEIKSSPFNVTVTSEGVDPNNTTAEGDGLTNAVAGEVAKFTVKTSDRFGNVIEDMDSVIAANLEPGDENEEAEPVECNITNNHDGTYSLDYTATTSGDYDLNVRCNGDQIQNSPFQVSVAAGPAAPSRTVATGDGLRNAKCGQIAKFNVRTKDQFRNLVTSPDGVEITGALIVGGGDANPDNDKPIPIEAKFRKNGLWNCTYIPEVAGNYPLEVKLNGKQIRGSKFNVAVVAGGVDVSKTIARGEGLEGTKAGQTARFIVICRDQYGNELRQNDISKLGLVASFEGPEEVDVLFAEQQRVKGVWCFPAEYLCNKPGEYQLSLKVKGQDIQGSPFDIVAQAGKPSAGNCHAEGEGLHTAAAGDEAEFLVMVCDQWGNVLKVDEQTTITATMDGPAPITPTLTSTKDDGTLCWNYTPKVASTSHTKYSLSIKLDGKDIIGSPFAVFVSPSQISPPDCFVSSDNAAFATAVAGSTSPFTVQTMDGYGNALPLGGHKLAGVLTAEDGEGEPINCDVVDVKDGTYDFSFFPTKSGEYKLDVTANGDAIKDSPFNVFVKEGPLNAANCVCEGEGLSSATANELAFFKVFTKDQYNNALTEGGAAITGVALYNGEADNDANFSAEIRDNNDGTYNAQYTAKKAGNYKLLVAANGDDVKFSPFTVTVNPGTASTSQTIAEGEGLSTCVCGEKATFRVTAKDDSGNLIGSGGANITGSLSGAQDKPIEVSVVDNGDGTYDADYSVTAAGTYMLDVKCEDEHIKDSPFEVKASPGPVDAKNCVASGDGLRAGVAGEPTKFQIQAKDAFGNPLTEGGLDFDVTLDPVGDENKDVPPVEGKVTDNDDGTYTVEYQAENAGPYEVNAALASGEGEGEPIKDSPFSLEIAPGAFDASQCTAEGDGLKDAVAGHTARFVIQARDQFGNPLEKGGETFDGVLAVGGDDDDDTKPVECKIRDNNDGTYAGSYKPVVAGDYTLALSSADVGIKDSPWDVTVAPGEVLAGNCEAEGEGLSAAICGEPAGFYIEAKDANGNAVPTAAVTGTFTAVLTYEDGESTSAEISPEELLYLCHYTATVSGTARLDIQYNGNDIKDSPFKVAIRAGAVSGANSELEGDLLRTCGEEFGLIVHLKDEFNNDIDYAVPTADWTVGLEPAAKDTPVFVDNDDFTKTLQFKAFERDGEFDLAIGLGEAGALNGSPFELAVVPGPVVDGIWIEESPEGELVAGKDKKVTLQALDEWGNHSIVGGAAFEFQIEGPENKKIVPDDIDDGTYTAVYNLKKAGEYTFKALLDGKQISKSPWKFIVVPDVVSGKYSIALGGGLEVATAGEEASFMVQSRDQYDNDITVGGATVVAILSSNDGESRVEGIVVDNEDGIYNVTYVAEISQRHTLEVTLNAENVQKSPFSVRVLPGKVNVDKSSAIGKTENDGAPGGQFFTLQARDRFGNDKVKGGDDVAIFLTKPVRRPAIVTDNGDGTYGVKYPYGIEEGDWDVEVTLDNQKMNSETIPKDVHVHESDPLAEEQSEYLSTSLPKSGSKINSLMLQLTPEERAVFIEELKAMQG